MGSHLTLGGLASGMDTNAVVAQLMQIEAQSKTRLQGRQYKSEQTKTVLEQMATRLRTLKTATDDLKSISTWGNVQKVTTSDAAKVSASYKSGAAVGVYSVEVLQLARADQRFYSVGAVTGATQIDINGTKIDIADGATKEQIAAAINAKADSPAFASVVGTELVLSGKKTGVALTVTGATFLTETSRRENLDAQYSINGVRQTDSPTNVVTGLPGVELTLRGLTATTGAISVEVGAPGPDQAALKTKVKAFVDAYNAAIDLIKTKTEEKSVRSPVMQTDYGKGALRGDPGLLSLMSRMRQVVTETVPTGTAPANPLAYDRLSDIGISVPASSGSEADRLAGKLVIDDAKLTAAIEGDPLAVRRLLGGVNDVPGLSQALTTLIDPIAKVADGDLAKRAANTDRETARIKDAMTLMDQRLKLKEERLRKQFTAMETALANTQSQTSWLQGQIGALS